MTYANPNERAALIEGFRALTDYLEANPSVPAPRYADVHTFPPDGGCTEMPDLHWRERNHRSRSRHQH